VKSASQWIGNALKATADAHSPRSKRLLAKPTADVTRELTTLSRGEMALFGDSL
jgi:hypothetical protein